MNICSRCIKQTTCSGKKYWQDKGDGENNVCKAYTKVEYFYNDFICILNQK